MSALLALAVVAIGYAGFGVARACWPRANWMP